MDLSIFESTDYKRYLTEVDESRPRGFRKALAQATHCQTAYISHVLNGSGHFNLEQAEATSRFLEMGRDETRFFLMLVEHNRAGTPSLRRVLGEQMDEMRERHLSLRKRVGIQATLSRENQATYYSSWHYAAVHMAVTVPSLRTRSALGRALRLSSRKLIEVLDFLVSVGLLNRQGDQLTSGSTLLHLEKDSPLIFQHHANWRGKAMASMHEEHADASVHYSSVVTLSAEDVQKIRALITQNLSEWIQIVKDSKEEQVYGLGIDFFRVD
ncbi:TIGR02147 family protein [Bdellovibrionota bacterium FG-1]